MIDWDGTLGDLILSTRTVNALKHYYDWDKRECRPITTMGQLLALTESDLLQQHNFGRVSLAELKATLEEQGLYLGMPLPPVLPGSPDWWRDTLNELT